MRVRNLEGTEDCPCCESWLKHWENNAEREAGLCSKVGCDKPAEVGGHVEITHEDNDLAALRNSKYDEFIIPICKGCNSKHGEEYEIKPGTVPIPTEKCGQG